MNASDAIGLTVPSSVMDTTSLLLVSHRPARYISTTDLPLNKFTLK